MPIRSGTGKDVKNYSGVSIKGALGKQVELLHTCPDEHRTASRDERWLNTELRGTSCVLDEVKRRPVLREATFTIANTHSPLPPVVSKSILKMRQWPLTSI